MAIAGRIIKGLHSLSKEMGLMSLKANAVFGVYRKEVEQMADETANSMGLTETQFVNAAASIQDLLIPIGFARKEATGMTKDTMALAGALSAWTGGMYSAEEVGRIFAKAVLGEREELKSLGIAISEAEVQARLLEKGQKNLTGQMLAQAKAQATLELITEKSTDAQAAFKDAQGNIVITSAEVKANIRGIAENIATILKPALEGGTTAVNTLTSALKTMSDEAALIAQSDVLTTWEKWQYRLAGLTGGVNGAIKQMEILGMAMSETHFDAMVDELLATGGTIEQVEKMLEQFGEQAVAHGVAYYEKMKKLRERDQEETAAATEAANQARIEEQQKTYWTLEGQMMAHGEAMKNLMQEGYTGQNIAVSKLNSGLEEYHTNLGALMEQIPLVIGPIRIFNNAVDEQAERLENMKYMWQEHIDAYAQGGELINSISSSMAMAASDTEGSLRSVASAAIHAAKRSIGAFIAEGIAAQVKSALTNIPFPFGLIAAGIAGGAAAALFNTLIPSFAEGGMVTQPTLALVGDNPSGKEMIIPWEKIGELNREPVEVGGILRGNDFHLMNKRTQDKFDRTGRS